MADILSQDEVDLLLNAVSDGDIGDAEEQQAKPTSNDRVTDKIHAVLILNFGEARSSEFVANIRTLENTHGL